MLEIKNLSVYHNKDLTPLISDLSFTLRPGERAALIGEEGNGKSTLLRLLAGQDVPYVTCEGQVLVTGARGYLPQELPAQEREKSAYEYFADSPVFFDQTPRELAALARELSLPQDVFYSGQPLASFSGGERVKLQMARILMEKPSLLLLDEPTNDLDLAAVRWLADFLCRCELPAVFVSHDEALLERAANVIILLERLRRRQVPRASVWRMDYKTFVRTRASGMAHQEQVARKEREEIDAKLRRFEDIRRRVEHDQNAISRRDPGGGRLLKKKMHAVMSMGRRFESERDSLTAMPESEEAIFARLTCTPQPAGKVVIDAVLPALCAGGRVLCRDVRLQVRAGEKLLITGRNGVGKSTLLRALRDMLRERKDLNVFYMPQDPCDLLDLTQSPVELLALTHEKDETTANRVALGSMKFTPEEMEHPADALSGGQKAKLLFLMMAQRKPDVLLLDEPTRNLSPLSGPVVRALFSGYPGCIVAVSHDRRFAREVFTRAVELTEQGLRDLTQFDT